MVRWLLCALLLTVPVFSQAIETLHPGDAAPAFSLADLSGTEFSLDALGEHPRVVLFWSTWSPRSLEALEGFRAFHERWAAEGLTIVAVNADSEQMDSTRIQTVRECVDRLQVPFPVLVDSGLRTYASYGIMALPSAVLVDAKGRISYVLGGYAETMREELNEKILLAMGSAPAESAVVVASKAPR